VIDPNPLGEGFFFAAYLVQHDPPFGHMYVAKVLKDHQYRDQFYQEVFLHVELLDMPVAFVPRYASRVMIMSSSIRVAQPKLCI
jgi:hypothetical protein